MFVVGIIVAATAAIASAWARRSRGRRLARPALFVLLVGAAVAVFSTPAYAHHPIVTGDVACSSDGASVVITWHLQNSESVLPAGTGRIMSVNSASVDRGTLSGITTDTTVLPQPLPLSTVDGSTTLAATATGAVTLTVDVRWDSPGPQTVVGSWTVTLPGSCAAPLATTTTTAVTTTTTAPATTTTTTTPATTTTLPATTTTTPATTTTSTLITIPLPTTTTAPTTTSTSMGAATTTTQPTTTSTSVNGDTTTSAAPRVLGTVVEQPTERARSLANTGSPVDATTALPLAAGALVLGALALRLRRAVGSEQERL